MKLLRDEKCSLCEICVKIIGIALAFIQDRLDTSHGSNGICINGFYHNGMQCWWSVED